MVNDELILPLPYLNNKKGMPALMSASLSLCSREKEEILKQARNVTRVDANCFQPLSVKYAFNPAHRKITMPLKTLG